MNFNKKIKEKLNKNITLILNEKTKFNYQQRTFDYISLAKIISSYGVIALHLNNYRIFRADKKKVWIIENMYETFFYFSVPFFVLCIGATLLNFNERYGLLEYNKRRFIKVFIPLLGWTFVLYLYKFYILHNTQRIKLCFSYLWNYFFLSKLYPIFNSLHIFLKTYMMIPLLAYIEKSKKLRIYIYYFFLLFITQTAFPYLLHLFGGKIIFIYNLDIGYLIYIFAGYIIHNHTFSTFSKLIIFIFGIISFFIHLIGTQTLTFKYNKIIKLHKGYLNLPCIIYSCALFLFIKEFNYLLFSIINKKFINKIGSLTLGPFFIHNAIIESVNKSIKLRSIISFNLLFHSFIIFSICIFLTIIIKKIPILNILVP